MEVWHQTRITMWTTSLKTKIWGQHCKKNIVYNLIRLYPLIIREKDKFNIKHNTIFKKNIVRDVKCKYWYNFNHISMFDTESGIVYLPDLLCYIRRIINILINNTVLTATMTSMRHLKFSIFMQRQRAIIMSISACFWSIYKLKSCQHCFKQLS
jgi:hypothetical protein